MLQQVRDPRPSVLLIARADVRVRAAADHRRRASLQHDDVQAVGKRELLHPLLQRVVRNHRPPLRCSESVYRPFASGTDARSCSADSREWGAPRFMHGDPRAPGKPRPAHLSRHRSYYALSACRAGLRTRHSQGGGPAQHVPPARTLPGLSGPLAPMRGRVLSPGPARDDSGCK